VYKRQVNTNSVAKPFGYPLKELIGVTQWHGYTAYQKPHTGIDFGATKKEVIAISDGEVVTKGWDNFNGECMSGGNYLVIKQSNGMYSAYFHLQEIYVNTGQKVTKSQVLGISGNTGSWNCQALGYHLHFETRLSRNQNSHVNPVEYINVDWSKVLTLNAKSNSGRLSGNNPHPNF
jgi:murein DD-endopeptidase MepM/ murein hydrolase activator NlpD